MLRKLFDKGRCGIGLHAGDWSYFAPGRCLQERICVRCQTRSERVEHDWGSWAGDATTACRFVRRCRRCAVEEEKVEHAWGEPGYVSDGSCRQVRRCSGCGTEAEAGTHHVWNTWTYVGDESCEQSLSCTRCHRAGSETRVRHYWSGWEQSAFYDAHVVVCGHCGDMRMSTTGPVDPEHAISFPETYRALWSVIESPDAATVRERISEHQGLLLSPVAPRCLAFTVDQVVDDEGAVVVRQLGELLDRCRAEGIEAVFAPPAPQETVTTAPLVGQWRSTEAISSSGFSLVTDTHMVLGPDGRARWWSHSASGLGETRSDEEEGAWSADGHVLTLRFAGGAVLAWDYLVDGSRLAFPGDNRYGFWERVGTA